MSPEEKAIWDIAVAAFMRRMVELSPSDPEDFDAEFYNKRRGAWVMRENAAISRILTNYPLRRRLVDSAQEWEES